MLLRTDIKNHNFLTCPNSCDWTRLLFKENVLLNNVILSKEWSSKNGSSMHLALIHIATKKYWWNCRKCHGVYQCSIPIRLENINTCPYCTKEKILKGFNSFEDLHPNLAKMWSSKNKLKTDEFIPNIKLRGYFKWNCYKCQLEFEARLFEILDLSKSKELPQLNPACPYCTKKLPNPKTESLDVVKPFLIKEWKSKLYGKICEVFPDSKRTVYWKCRVCQLNFRAKICDRSINDSCCKNCNGYNIIPGVNDISTTHPHIIKEWDFLNNILLAKINTVGKRNIIKVWWICQENPNHRYKMSVRDKLKYKKRKKEPCSICKGLRRKREHFVQYKD